MKTVPEFEYRALRDLLKIFMDYVELKADLTPTESISLRERSITALHKLKMIPEPISIEVRGLACRLQCHIEQTRILWDPDMRKFKRKGTK